MKNLIAIDFDNQVVKIRCYDSETGEFGFVLIDLEDLKIVDASCDGHWTINHTGTGKYVMGMLNGSQVYIHRVVMRLKRGDRLDVHHLYNDTTDNRKASLRTLTRSQHRMVTPIVKPRAINTTGYLGVSLYKPRRKKKHHNLSPRVTRYRAFFARQTLGIFDTPQEAGECSRLYREQLYKNRASAVAAAA
jgi:hypothetical protein